MNEQPETTIPFPSPIRPRCRLARIPAATSAEDYDQRLAPMIEALKRAAAADHHTVLAPTHVVVRGDEIVGYASVGGLPTLHVWLDSKQVHAAESMRLLETVETLVADRGVQMVCMPCAENSPFFAHMERLGFEKLGTTVLFVKRIPQ